MLLRIALLLLVAAATLSAGYAVCRDWFCQDEVRAERAPDETDPLIYYAQVDREAPPPRNGTRIMTRQITRRPTMQELAPNQRCVGGTVVVTNGFASTQVLDANGDPRACSIPIGL